MCYFFWIILSTFFVSVTVATQSRIRNVDVAVIGGGVSGTYAAVRLYDQRKDIVLIETHDYLGGNTETYSDPSTNTPVDIGVQIFENTSTVLDYFARFKIPLAKADLTVPGTTKYLDFSTGKPVSGPASSSNPQDQAAAFAIYSAQQAKYPYLSSPISWTMSPRINSSRPPLTTIVCSILPPSPSLVNQSCSVVGSCPSPGPLKDE